MLEMIGAGLIGLALGAVFERTHFCTMGAISDFTLFGSRRRLAAWALAIAIALPCVRLLVAVGVLDLAGSPYTTARLDWLSLGIGGLIFGYGMVLAGGCASRNLVRFAAGSLKALLVLLLMALSAAVLTFGPAAGLRTGLTDLTGVTLPAAAQTPGALIGIMPSLVDLVLAVAVAGLLARGLIVPAGRRALDRQGLLVGVTLGLAVPLGWLVSEPGGAAITFVEPAGALLAYLTSGAAPLGFAATLIVTLIVGAALSAAAGGRFRIETFTDKGDMVRHTVGGVLMGLGGVLAMGCTIGQGVTGVATMALGSFLALAAIIAGAVLALRALEHGSLRAYLSQARPFGLRQR